MSGELEDWLDANAAAGGAVAHRHQYSADLLHPLPVVAAPVSLAQGMPTAVQIITAAWREYLALRITYDLEAHGPSRTATAEISAGPVVAAGEEEPLPRLPCASGRGGYRSAQPE
jgi:hypothetical protein